MNLVPTTIHIACLCAAWCRTCDDYESVLAAAAADWQGRGPLKWHWIDIENHADLVDDFDVETFPTLLIFDDASIRFAGTVTPHAATLSRLVQAAVESGPTSRGQLPDLPTRALVERLRTYILSHPDLAPRTR